ncbi:uncharacterized protein F4807DRAFT_428746 [Annulohypoxylon truncatum]|uniref:uncharacterized protein n=1 Tax=Annulohypoxylon truncatum TaxID=327061 RepID=UPI002008280A|nr:uncharacterized protein F4807DRAFT_428746 [Annulohypoxylon truncatum]KAI1209053.1 hypothetical protein F4807DRAFT_428746 [Annulohypoxylon truncatum]
MSLDSFHLFPRLPPELRRKIYLLATPSRIVHLRKRLAKPWLGRWNEVEPIDFDKFKLHPHFCFFAKEFHQIISFCQDLQSSPNPLDVPRPFGIRQVYAEREWRFFVEARFYSKAVIPALLHTCVESRSVLVESGYELAFGTRYHEPRTWFHFENDVLYPQNAFDGCLSFPSMLSAYFDSPLARLDINSLERVRKIILDSAYFTLREYGRASCVARLFPKLLKLYLAPWFPRDELFESETRPQHESKENVQKRRRLTYKRKPWKHVPAEAMDVLFHGCDEFDIYPQLFADSPGSPVPSPRDFRSLIDGQVQAQWIEEIKDAVAKEPFMFPQEVPKIEVVHVFPEYYAERIFNARQYIWKQYLLAQRELDAPLPRQPRYMADIIDIREEVSSDALRVHALQTRYGASLSQRPPRQEVIMGP